MHKANNFDILRLIFALAVVCAHAAELSGSPDLSWLPKVCNSQVAVEGFFAMSGFLIVGSWERSRSLGQYLGKRARRILPAYWASLIFCLFLGCAITTMSPRTFLGSPETWKFAACNLLFVNFLHPTLPGVFTGNPGVPAVNGALWTIKLEVMFYLLVPVLVWVCRRLGTRTTVSVMFMLSLAFRAVCIHLHHDSLAKQLPGQLCFFAGGIFVYYFLPYFTQRKAATWVVVVGLVIAYVVFGGVLLEAVAIPLGTMAAAFLLPHIQGPTRYGDYSYGIYVFHFPIIQALVALGAFSMYPYVGLTEALLAVTVLAVGSWRFIESPALVLGRSGRVEASEMEGGGKLTTLQSVEAAKSIG